MFYLGMEDAHGRIDIARLLEARQAAIDSIAEDAEKNTTDEHRKDPVWILLCVSIREAAGRGFDAGTKAAGL